MFSDKVVLRATLIKHFQYNDNPLLQMTPENVLLRWVNHHLERFGPESCATNLGSDMSVCACSLFAGTAYPSPASWLVHDDARTAFDWPIMLDVRRMSPAPFAIGT